MTTLLFIRHGIAEDWRPGKPDSERALTEEGWAKTRAAMKGLVALGYVPDRGVSSPFRRALETMACLKEAAGTGFPVGYSELFMPDSEPAEVEAWLRILLRGAGANEILAFTSHQPLLGDLVAHLTGAAVDMKKAACSVVAWDGQGWALDAHLLPSELRNAGGGA
jgi:phosphohistidine phosphatase